MMKSALLTAHALWKTDSAPPARHRTKHDPQNAVHCRIRQIAAVYMLTTYMCSLRMFTWLCVYVCVAAFIRAMVPAARASPALHPSQPVDGISHGQASPLMQ
jgi:hypothetical protein